MLNPMDGPGPMGSAQTSGTATQDTPAALFGRLRALRCRAQRFRDLTAQLQASLETLTDTAMRAQELASALLQSQTSAHDNSLAIRRLIIEIMAITNSNDSLYCEYGDAIASIDAEWSATADDRATLIQANVPDPERLLRRLSASLDMIVYRCCEITVPARIRDHLALLPIGAALNFHDAYSDELPSREQRRRLLRYLTLYPDAVPGLVDVDNEKILRASEKRVRRVMSLVWTVAIALGGFGAIAIACYAGGSGSRGGDPWPFTTDHMQAYMSAYAFLLLGSLTHVVINLLKQDRAASESPQYLDNWVLRIHVRETSYFISALSLWLGAAAMGFLFSSGIDSKTAFFLGYSYDSFMDLFLKRFENIVPKVSSIAKDDSSIDGGRTGGEESKEIG